MSLPVEIAERAELDLIYQYRWYQDNASCEVAERFLKAFDVTVALLANHPGLGRPRHFRSPELKGLHSFPIGERFGVHLIFYGFSEEAIGIKRVLHGARDLPPRLLEGSSRVPDD